MALNSVIRRASRVVPLAIRASAGSQRHLHNHHRGAAVNQTSRNFFPAVAHHYSTNPKSDELLLRVLKSEIIETRTEEEMEIFESSPFKLEEYHEHPIKFAKECNGENISLEIQMRENEDEYEDEDEHEDEDDQQITQYCFPMVIKVSKPNSPSLEFSCTAYSDEITIDSVSIKVSEDQIAYDFGDLDENLQKALHKYLEIRGIIPFTINFLTMYIDTVRDMERYIDTVLDMYWLESL